MMDKRTSDALEGSIAHWEKNAAADTPTNASTDASSCALCGEFQSDDFNCDLCPVSAHTKMSMCSGTPYIAANTAFKRWFRNPNNETSRVEWRAAAQAELNFLISLRDMP